MHEQYDDLDEPPPPRRVMLASDRLPTACCWASQSGHSVLCAWRVEPRVATRASAEIGKTMPTA